MVVSSEGADVTKLFKGPSNTEPTLSTTGTVALVAAGHSVTATPKRPSKLDKTETPATHIVAAGAVPTATLTTETNMGANSPIGVLTVQTPNGATPPVVNKNKVDKIKNIVLGRKKILLKILLKGVKIVSRIKVLVALKRSSGSLLCARVTSHVVAVVAPARTTPTKGLNARITTCSPPPGASGPGTPSAFAMSPHPRATIEKEK